MRSALYRPLLGFHLLCSFTLAAQQVGIGAQQSSDRALAEQYFKQQEYRKALDFLAPEMEDSRDKRVYEIAWESFLELQDYRAAEKWALDWRKRLPQQRENFEVDLIFLYLKQDKTRKAERVQEDIEEQIAAQPGRAYIYAKVLQSRGYPERAMAVFQAAIAVRPQMNFDYQMAQLYGEMGELKKMYDLYIQMVERNPGYLGNVKMLLSQTVQQGGLPPEEGQYFKEQLVKKIQAGASPKLNELLVHVFVQEKDFASAFTQLRALERRGAVSSGELFRLAQMTEGNGQWALAERIYTYLKSKGPEDAFYNASMMAFLRSKKEQLSQSGASAAEWQSLAESYRKEGAFLAAEPQKAQWLLDRAEIAAYHLGQEEAAQGFLEDILATGFVSKSNRARAYIALGDLKLYQGERYEAILHYRRAERDFEQSPLGQEAKFKRAKAAYYAGDFEWAQNIFDVLKASVSKLIANDAMRYSLLIKDNMALDSNTEVLSAYARADLHFFQNQLDSARRLLEILALSYSDHPIHDELLFRLGEIHLRQGQKAEAAARWQELVDAYPKGILSDEALYRLALLQQEMGQLEAAAQSLEDLFIRFPDSYFSAEARREYRRLRGESLP